MRKAPIILYFAQPNDTLWSIAKNYRIPVSRLAADNGLEAEAKPEVGKRLFIM
jgi:LysM repeat protein